MKTMDVLLTYAGPAALGICLLLLLLLLLLFMHIKGNHQATLKIQSQLTKEFKILSQKQKQQDEMLNELKMATTGISKKLLAVQQEITVPETESQSLLDIREQVVELAGKLQAMESSDPELKLYSRASKLIASGASLDEVMQECELPRAEAELMMSLHAK